MSSLSDTIKAVLAVREALGADVDDADLLEGMIEGETDLMELFDQLLEANARDIGMSKGARQAAADIEARADRLEAAVDRRRTVIEQAMSIAGLTKVIRPCATLSMAPRGASVIITNEAAIPARFWKAGKPTLDKKALKEALETNETIEGASLSNRAPSLTIRSK